MLFFAVTLAGTVQDINYENMQKCKGFIVRTYQNRTET